MALTFLRSPNKWSCTAAAFAMVLNMPFTAITSLVGHDGSEVLYPELPEPLCRRGFHIQELTRICFQNGFAVIPIQKEPAGSPDGQRIHKIENLEFFNKCLRHYTGVMIGQGRQHQHAVAYSEGLIFDPSYKITPYPSPVFEPHTFYVVSKLI